MCFFWGTTYLGIRMAIESMTPAMMMFLRYTLSGGILLAGARLMGVPFPAAGEFWRTALYGVITIGFGTGSLAYAEESIPSGIAALMVTTQPFWMVGIESRTKGGEPLHAPAIWGMLVGLAGVALLVGPSMMGESGAVSRSDMLRGFLIMQISVATWSAGSVAQRRLPTRAHPILSGAIQQFATGIAFGVLVLIQTYVFQLGSPWTGELSLTSRGVGSVLYLAMFGGIVGYSAYIFAMDRLPVALVSIYTYINPLVALFLGWLFYREKFGWIEGIGMAIIFLGVWLVKRAAQGARKGPRIGSDSGDVPTVVVPETQSE